MANKVLSTTLSLTDRMTAPVLRIRNALTSLTDGFNNVNNATDLNTDSLTRMRQQVEDAANASEELNEYMERMGASIRGNTSKQNSFNSALNTGANNAGKIMNKIAGIAAAYVSLQSLGKVITLSDTMTGITSRLGLMNDGLQTTDELISMIYSSAQRSGGAFLDSANAVSRLGIVAKDAFSSNEEAVAFAEQLNKQFAISGSSVSETTNAMYQLMQAMAAGKLQGDEFRSIMENAPMLAQAIARYMGKTQGELKEMSSEGLITADIIKNALFSTADETNKRFEKLPKTFSRVWTEFKNEALMAFNPILNKLNEIANSTQFQTLLDNIIILLVSMKDEAIYAINAIINGLNFLVTHWDEVLRVVKAVVTAMIAYKAIMIASNAISAISAIAAKTMAMAHAAQATAAKIATAAQQGLNAALLAFPGTWIIAIIVIIIGLLYAVVAGINAVTGATYSATGIIVGVLLWVGGLLGNIVRAAVDIILAAVSGIVNVVIDLVNFLGNVFVHPLSTIVHQWQVSIDVILSMLHTLARVIDGIFGTNLSDMVGGWRESVKSFSDEIANKIDPGGYQDIISRVDLNTSGTFGWERIELDEAFDAGYWLGEQLENGFNNIMPGNTAIDVPNPDDYAIDYSKFQTPVMPTIPTTDIEGIQTGVGDIAENTRATADFSEEELKLWRDIAERDVINRFTTAQVTVSFGGVTNNVASDYDLDGIIDYIGSGVQEALLGVAEGVHVA
jgi:tape measure domain-containing protein